MLNQRIIALQCCVDFCHTTMFLSFIYSLSHSLDRDWISMHFGNLRTTSSNKVQSLFLKILTEQRNLFTKKRGLEGRGNHDPTTCIVSSYFERRMREKSRTNNSYLSVDKTMYAIISSLVLLIRLLTSFLSLSVVLSPTLILQAACPVHPQPTAHLWWFLMSSPCLSLNGLLWAEANTVPTESVSTSLTSPTGLCWIVGFKVFWTKEATEEQSYVPPENPWVLEVQMGRRLHEGVVSL